MTLLVTFLFLDKGPINTILIAEDFKALIVYITSNLLIDFSIGEYLFYGSMDTNEFLHANNFNILIQSWSLDLEILFYIIAPFILTLKKFGYFFINFTMYYIEIYFSFKWLIIIHLVTSGPTHFFQQN